jgi:PAS domain S-box-containing protein
VSDGLEDLSRDSLVALVRALRGDLSTPPSSSADDTRRLLHDLRLHQVELEQQNQELRESQQDLEASRARYADLFDSAPVGCCTLDRSCVVLGMNLTGASMLGLDRATLVGCALPSLFRGDSAAALLAHVRACFEGKAPAFEASFVHRQLGPVVLEFLSSPVREGQGVVVAAHTVFRDVTTRRVADEALRKAEEQRQRAEQERLALLDRERTARLAAERAARVKDEFLAVVSHELRTPVAAVLMWSEVLRRAEDGEQRARALDAIDESARAQSRLIDDLIEVARGVRENQPSLRLAPVDLFALVSGCVASNSPLAAERGVELICSGDEGCELQADAERLRQVIDNLLSNALKFTPRGGSVTVTVEASAEAIVLRVSDTGEGIEPAFLPDIFEPFRQEDGSSTRAAGGLGLGLAIVRELIGLHGGRIAASSAGKGKGATFTATFPRAPGGLGPTPATGGSALPVGVTVLLVDDDEVTSAALRQLLEGHGALVREARSVDQAIAQVEQAPPDVVVSDLAMPGKDGFHFLKELRAIDGRRGRHTPVVALTAATNDLDRDRALRAGFERHVPKHVAPDELVSVIATLAAAAGDRAG